MAENNTPTSDDVKLDDQLPDDTAPAELIKAVDEMLDQLGTKFSTISNDLLTKMDEMSKRLDKLESQIQQQGSVKDGEPSA